MHRCKWSALYSDGHQATEQIYRLQVSIKESLQKNGPNISHQFAFSWQFLWLLWEKVTVRSIFLLRETFSESKIGGLLPQLDSSTAPKIREVFYQSGWSDSNGSSSLWKFGMEFLGAFFGAQQNFQLFSSRVPFNSTFFFRGPHFTPRKTHFFSVIFEGFLRATHVTPPRMREEIAAGIVPKAKGCEMGGLEEWVGWSPQN